MSGRVKREYWEGETPASAPHSRLVPRSRCDRKARDRGDFHAGEINKWNVTRGAQRAPRGAAGSEARQASRVSRMGGGGRCPAGGRRAGGGGGDRGGPQAGSGAGGSAAPRPRPAPPRRHFAGGCRGDWRRRRALRRRGAAAGREPGELQSGESRDAASRPDLRAAPA